jgi:hypothetical protein
MINDHEKSNPNPTQHKKVKFAIINHEKPNPNPTQHKKSQVCDY